METDRKRTRDKDKLRRDIEASFIKIVNKNRSPLEFRLDGKMYLLEPTGMEGDSCLIPASALERIDYKAVKKYVTAVEV